MEDHRLGCLSGPEGNLQAMTKQSTSSPVVMSLDAGNRCTKAAWRWITGSTSRLKSSMVKPE